MDHDHIVALRDRFSANGRLHLVLEVGTRQEGGGFGGARRRFSPIAVPRAGPGTAGAARGGEREGAAARAAIDADSPSPPHPPRPQHVDRCLLDDLDASPGGLTPGTTRRLLAQLAAALAHLHARGVVHRDVKPENVLVSAAGLVKLCDFGFARCVPGCAAEAGGGRGGRAGDRAAPRPPLSDYVATRWYRAPELLVGDRGYGPGVDVWALGCMAVEVATGRPLFPGESDADQLARVVRCVGGLTRAHRAAAATNAHLASTAGGAAAARARGAGAASPGASLADRFPQLDPALLAVVSACLHPDPACRATAGAVLGMPYFEGVSASFGGAWHAERAASAAARARPLGPTTDPRDPVDGMAPPPRVYAMPTKGKAGGASVSVSAVAVAAGGARAASPPARPPKAPTAPRAVDWAVRQAELAGALGGGVKAAPTAFGESPSPGACGGAADAADAMAVDGSPDTPVGGVKTTCGMASPWRALRR